MQLAATITTAPAASAADSLFGPLFDQALTHVDQGALALVRPVDAAALSGADADDVISSDRLRSAARLHDLMQQIGTATF